MNIFVALFFLHNVLATALLGGKFFARKDKVLKSFGIALLLNCVAFAIWSLAVLTQPQNIATYVTYGVVFFIAALVFLLNTGTQDLKPGARQKILIGGSVLAAVLFYLRTFVYSATPSFSPEGFFFFNVHPLMQMFYIFALVISSLLALKLVASRFSNGYATLIWFCFLIEVIGGVLLITTRDSQVLYLTGLIMGTAYVALWVPLLLNSKSWPTK